MANSTSTVPVPFRAKLAAEAVTALSDTLKAIPSAPAQLLLQLQAATTLFVRLDEFPENVDLDAATMGIINKIRDFCLDIKVSIDQHACSGSNDWIAFQESYGSFERSAANLQLYVTTVTIGTIAKLRSKNLIAFTAQGNQDYNELIADAVRTSEATMRDAESRIKALDEATSSNHK